MAKFQKTHLYLNTDNVKLIYNVYLIAISFKEQVFF